MLDIEVVVEPTEDGTDILSVADLKKRLRITHSRLDDVLEDCIIEAAADLHGIDSELRRSVFPTTYRRYLTKFPDMKNDRGEVCYVGRGVIPMPFPPLLAVQEIVIEDGESPTNQVDPTSYVVRKGTNVGEIELTSSASWPSYTAGPRAISILFRAGYDASNGGYPAPLKRLVALKAAHNFLNPSASLNEPRVLQINRRTEFGVAELRRKLSVPLSYDNWGED